MIRCLMLLFYCSIKSYWRRRFRISHNGVSGGRRTFVYLCSEGGHIDLCVCGVALLCVSFSLYSCTVNCFSDADRVTGDAMNCQARVRF